MNRKDKEWEDDGRTIAEMNVDGMPWYNPNITDKNKTDKDNPTRAERKAIIKAGFLATLPFFLATVCAFVALMLLMTLWLG